MATRTMFSVILVSTILAACGGSKATPQSRAREREHEHPTLPPTLGAFHDVLSPIWHADPGPARIAAACDKATVLQQSAAALVSEPTPTEVSTKVEVWKVATSELVSAVQALANSCGPVARADVEARLTDVHEAFHKVGTTVTEMGDHGDYRPPSGTGRHGGSGEH